MTAGDPNQRTYDHAEFVKIVGGGEWWRNFQALVLLLDAYSRTDTVNLRGDEPSEKQPCAQCNDSRWTGQDPCSWCNNPPEAGMFRDVHPADALRLINYLRTTMHGWYDDRRAELVRGIPVVERVRHHPCPHCAGKVRAGWVACPHCGESLATSITTGGVGATLSDIVRVRSSVAPTRPA